MLPGPQIAVGRVRDETGPYLNGGHEGNLNDTKR